MKEDQLNLAQVYLHYLLTNTKNAEKKKWNKMDDGLKKGHKGIN